MPMVLFIQAVSTKTSTAVEVLTAGNLARAMMEIGWTIECKDKAVIPGQTELSLSVSSRTINPTVKADTPGKTAVSTKVAGQMGNKTVLDTTAAIMDLQDKVCGLMASYRDGSSDSN